MSVQPPHVVVVGAGVAGLAATGELRRHGAAVTVLEREPEPGGRVRTVELEGVPVNLGTQFVASFCTETVAALRAGGLGADLVPDRERSAVVAGGRAHRIDSPAALIAGGLLSVPSRLRLPGLALPLLAAWPRLDSSDLTAAAPFDRRPAIDLVRRWAGEEVACRAIGPIVRGLLYWDLETTSQGVLLTMLRAAASGASVFRVRGGMRRVAETLAGGLDVRLGTTVTGLAHGAGGRAAVTVADADGERVLECDGVVCATTAGPAAQLLADAPSETLGFLRSTSYSRTTIVVVRVPSGVPLPHTSLLFPTDTVRSLASVNPPRLDAGPGRARFVRISLSDEAHAAMAGLDGEGLTQAALALVREAGAGGEWTERATPAHALRWEEALPRFPAGRLRAEGMLRPDRIDYGRVALAGDYLRAPHVEGALLSGRAAAGRLLRVLRSVPTPPRPRPRPA